MVKSLAPDASPIAAVKSLAPDASPTEPKCWPMVSIDEQSNENPIHFENPFQGKFLIDGYLSFIQEWMCSYEHCSGVSFKGDLLSGLVFIPGRFPGWVDTSLWIRLGGRVSIDGYYEHCSHTVSFQRNNVRATITAESASEKDGVHRAQSGGHSE